MADVALKGCSMHATLVYTFIFMRTHFVLSKIFGQKRCSALCEIGVLTTRHG